jgi:hypothetical protein
MKLVAVGARGPVYEALSPVRFEWQSSRCTDLMILRESRGTRRDTIVVEEKYGDKRKGSGRKKERR